MVRRDGYHQAIWRRLRALPVSSTALRVDTDWGTDWTVLPGQNPFWRALTMEQPGAFVYSGNERLALEPESVLVLPAGVGFRASASRAIEHYFVIFELTGIPPVICRRFFGRPVRIPVDPVLATLIRAARESAGLSLDRSLETCACASSFVWGVVAALVHTLPVGAARDLAEALQEATDLEPALAAVGAEMPHPPSIPELARRCGMSERTFLRRFRLHYGKTPSAYVLEQRLKEAALLLLRGAVSVEQIAEMTGFVDRFHLARQFKRQFGQTPAEYRKRRV